MKKQITKILLENFRNHDQFSTELHSGAVLFFGQNGIGKTSILEAISKLAPGRGLKSAGNLDIAKDGIKPWQTYFKFSSEGVLDSIGLGFDLCKKTIRINNKSAKSATDILDAVKVIWFTPQMNGIFTAQKSVRRAFFDRVLSNFLQSYLQHLLLYEKLKKERIEILLYNQSNKWLEVVEQRLSGLCIDITKSRLTGLQKLQNSIDEADFLKPRLKIECELTKFCDLEYSDSVCKVAEMFFKNREIDKKLAKTTFGVHLADFYALHPVCKKQGKLCSMGEQKAMLLAVLVACSMNCDILLLDDISAHIDKKNFEIFMKNMLLQKCQIFFTDIFTERFLEYCDCVEFIEVNKQKVLK